jgi:SAM-dependent methyltransferase
MQRKKMAAAARIARRIMNLAPSEPSPDDLSLWEVFRHEHYTKARPEEQARLQLASSRWRYEYEMQSDSLQRYFPTALDALPGARVLDLGCFTGGRLVAWAEKYSFLTATGIDINPIFAEAGRRFADERAAQSPQHQPLARFDTGVGEKLPYEDDSFDVIISLDVFEHVQDVRQVMSECRRVLAPGGLLLACFPQYFQPLESHLGMFTRVPALHWFFSGDSLASAIAAESDARGERARWYAYGEREEYERSPYLNGITIRNYRSIIRDQGWELQYWSREPIFSDGRRAQRPLFRTLRALVRPFATVPMLEEIFLGRICCVLEVPAR